MLLSNVHSLLAFAPLLCSLAQASNTTACPAIWSTVTTDLKSAFSGCNNQARSAIRFAFHDAAGYSSKNPVTKPASGGADGSLLLSSEEITRPIEHPLQNFQPWLLGKYNQYKDQGVGAADLVQFAGNIGIRSCPGGPIVQTLVGREDTSTSAPDGNLPEGFGAGSNYDSLTTLFAEKGFTTTDLAALVGAHTCSRAFAQRQIPRGGSQDSTPTTWDTKYYQELQSAHSKRDSESFGDMPSGDGGAPGGVFHFESDINLSNPNATVGQEMARFASSLDAFNSAFVDAMGRMNLLGIPKDVISGFQDCTHLIE